LGKIIQKSEKEKITVIGGTKALAGGIGDLRVAGRCAAEKERKDSEGGGS